MTFTWQPNIDDFSNDFRILGMISASAFICPMVFSRQSLSFIKRHCTHKHIESQRDMCIYIWNIVWMLVYSLRKYPKPRENQWRHKHWGHKNKYFIVLDRNQLILYQGLIKNHSGRKHLKDVQAPIHLLVWSLGSSTNKGYQSRACNVGTLAGNRRDWRRLCLAREADHQFQPRTTSTKK